MMTRRSSTSHGLLVLAALVLYLLALTAAAFGAEPRVSILRVTPRRAIGPSDVRVEVKVPQRQSNVSLMFEFECDSGFSRSSTQQLARERAALVHRYELRNVPPGRCVAFAWIATDEGPRGKAYRSGEELVVLYGPGVTDDTP